MRYDEFCRYRVYAKSIYSEIDNNPSLKTLPYLRNEINLTIALM